MTNLMKISITVMIVLIVASLAIGVWALFLRPDPPPLTPDYAPTEKEEHSEKIEGDDDTKLEAPTGGGAVNVTCSPEATIDLSDRTVSLYFANPGRSTQDMVIQIVIQDEILVQSGRIEPGNQVRRLDMTKDAANRLTIGGYDAKLVAHFYDPDTGEKSIVNAEVPITVTVTE